MNSLVNGAPVRVGLIGCGQAGAHSHLPALGFVPEVEVVALADSDPDRLNAAAKRFHVTRCYADYCLLLKDPAVEAVAVCVPVESHVETGIAVLDAGKHLFLEKPLALNLDEADRLIERAARSSRKVMLGFNLRWHRLAQRARELIQQDGLGALELIRSGLTSYHETIPEWRRTRARGGGVFFEQAVHHFDLWRFLTGAEVEEVFAVSRSGVWEDEAATITARLSNGVLAAAVFAVHTGKRNEVEVYGREACVSVSFYRFDSFDYATGASRTDGIGVRLNKAQRALRETPQEVLRLRQGGDFLISYQTEWRQFCAAIRNDVPVLCTLDDGRRALQIALAATRSVTLGRPVKVAEIS